MVEFFLTQFATAVSTFVVVSMATLFFCCWRKKVSRDIVANKPSSTKEDVKERSASPAPVAVVVGPNGQLTKTSRPAVVVTNEDLGDFSEVQRETEILRSYRKPPPPKNRARQSRAPRNLKEERESIDIFAELTEEDKSEDDGEEDKKEIKSEKESIAVTDELDSDVLRPRPEDKERPAREARSSMLMEIEQTLAKLHTPDKQDKSDKQESVFTKEINSVEDKLNQNHNDVSETHVEETKSPTNQISTSNSLLSSVVIKLDESSPGSLNTKPNHIVTPKQGPKVSPKPTPRSSARISAIETAVAANTGTEKQNISTVINFVNQNQATHNLSKESLTPASVINVARLLPQIQVETTTSGHDQEPPLPGKETVTTENIIQQQTHLTSTDSSIPSIPAVDVESKVICEGETADAEDKSEILQHLDTASPVNVDSGVANVASTASVDDKQLDSKYEAGDADSTSQALPEIKTSAADEKADDSESRGANEVLQSSTIETISESENPAKVDGGNSDYNETLEKSTEKM